MLTFGHCPNHLNPTTHSHDSSSPKPPRYSEPQQSCLFFYKQQVLQGHHISLLASSEPLKASFRLQNWQNCRLWPHKIQFAVGESDAKKAVHCLDNWRTFNTSTMIWVNIINAWVNTIRWVYTIKWVNTIRLVSRGDTTDFFITEQQVVWEPILLLSNILKIILSLFSLSKYSQFCQLLNL